MTAPHAALQMETINTDVLIIGAGLAGLSTALALPKSLHITLLSKAALEVCSSHYAQGGIAASLDKNDSVSDHIADTLIAGAGLCASANTAHILGAGQSAIKWLCAQGVPFTQNSQTLPANDNETTAYKPSSLKASNLKAIHIENLHLTQEGGHGCRRVAHADDATGKHVMQALAIKAQAAPNITILPYHEAIHLLTKPVTHSSKLAHLNTSQSDPTKHCQGAVVFDHTQQRQLTFYSGAVVLASGGLGQLFKRASAPNVCVGDGVMMAWQAGCRLANLEFVQFHPTGLALADSSFLISEALRGEGGQLYCPQTGTRFMQDIDPRAELAPRDIVARAISEQIDANGLGYVHLDISHLPSDFIRQHFPQIYQTLLDLGIDITTDPIPVAPTAHYSCGGVVTCANGLSDVQGLYAAGEVAYTGLHGANRLASNSLLECVVVGRNIAAHLPRYLAAATHWTTPVLTDTQTININPTINQAIGQAINQAVHPSKISHNDSHNINIINNSRDNKTTFNNTVASITAQLKALMTKNMGIIRSAPSLEQALIQIKQWQNECFYLTNNANLQSIRQLTQQLQLATLVIQSAYQRYESRGGHYRSDYPHLMTQPKVSIIEPLANEVFNSAFDNDVHSTLDSAFNNAFKSTHDSNSDKNQVVFNKSNRAKINVA